MDERQQRALITGSTRGIGWAIAIIAYAIIISNALYFFPVATINSFNHHLGKGGGKKRKGNKKKSGKKSASLPRGLSAMPAGSVSY